MSRNRLNDLDSKTYMKFLKSWFPFETGAEASFISFFTKTLDETNHPTRIGYYPDSPVLKRAIETTGRQPVSLPDQSDEQLHYALIDLRGKELSFFGEGDLDAIFHNLFSRLKHRAYVTLWMNCGTDMAAHRCAWDVARQTTRWFEMKDEKIGCAGMTDNDQPYLGAQGGQLVYAFNFRHTLSAPKAPASLTPPPHYPEHQWDTRLRMPLWFVLKPPPRKEKVKLHPAKYPEVLVERFIKNFSRPDDVVFDPMSGTGSTQIAAVGCHRRGYGLELNETFADIARLRLEQHNVQHVAAAVYTADAGHLEQVKGLPLRFDYVITSPPYWDMLNMKGAETQKSRKEKGLPVNYSDSETDLGNCPDYATFLQRLLRIYHKVIQRLRPGGYMTVIVKNIKKKGVIYPFAWDIVDGLSDVLEPVGINFWLQDDIRLAPYGYGNAWVSNTFHQYILTFHKPGKREV